MNEHSHLSAYSLDRLLLSSLPAEEEQEARAHLESCPECHELFAQMQADQRRFESAVFARTLPRLEERMARPSLLAWIPRGWKLAFPAAGAVAAALLLVLARPGPGLDPDLGIKGGPTLRVFARSGESVFQVKPGTRLAAGDRIRFVLEAPEPGYLLIASIDGASKVSVYFPPDGLRSAAIGAGRIEVPGSIELDDAPGPERLFAYFTREPLTADEVARALAKDPVSGALPQVTPNGLSFEKEAR